MTLDDLRKNWHDERIIACTEACEGIVDPLVAPKLLEALKAAIKQHDERIAIMKGREAIKKATGQKG